MAKRKCIFSVELKKSYNCFESVSTSKHEAHCTVCNSNVSISNKGRYDLEQHLASKKHKIALQGGEISKKVTNFFSEKFSKLEDKVAAIESTLAFHIVKHHQSFRSMNCTASVLKMLFTDSELVKKLSCAKTKTRAIIKNVISPYCITSCLDAISNTGFISISTDATNHGSSKIFPIIVQYFEKNTGINTKMISLESLPNETAETISNNILKCLEQFQLKNKCIAFSADNCNTNFGGIKRQGTNNVYNILKNKINVFLLGVGCPVHIVHNTAQHGLDCLEFDIESIVIKIYNYFSIYTIRTESLKEFCNFVEIEYKEIMMHSKTRWLSLFPVINRVLQVFTALKSYFLSLESCPRLLETFFKSEFCEAYLYFVHSFIYVFDEKSKKLELEKNSILEVMKILNELKEILKQRFDQSFLPLNVKSIFINLIRNGNEKEVAKVKSDFLKCYYLSLSYLESWTKQYEEFSCFNWMELIEVPDWKNAEITIVYLKTRSVDINDTKCFDQFCNLQKFIETKLNDETFMAKLSHDKWAYYFTEIANHEMFSELLKLCQYFFAIPGQNANVERLFSLMGLQWTKERNRLKLSTVRSSLSILYNFKDKSCIDFFKEIKDNTNFLRKVQSSQKYEISDSSTDSE